MFLVSIILELYLMEAHVKQNSHGELKDHNIILTKRFLFIKKYLMPNY